SFDVRREQAAGLVDGPDEPYIVIVRSGDELVQGPLYGHGSQWNVVCRFVLAVRTSRISDRFELRVLFRCNHATEPRHTRVGESFDICDSVVDSNSALDSGSQQ